MQLVDLCADVGSLDPSTPGVDVWIQSVEHDSRRVGAGALFVALPGRVSDGIRFVSDAVSNGAAAVALKVGSEKPPSMSPLFGWQNLVKRWLSFRGGLRGRPIWHSSLLPLPERTEKRR